MTDTVTKEQMQAIISLTDVFPSMVRLPPSTVRYITERAMMFDELVEGLRAWRAASEAEDAALELSERAEAEGWINDPTGSLHVHGGFTRANNALLKALELRDTLIAKAEANTGETT